MAKKQRTPAQIARAKKQAEKLREDLKPETRVRIGDSGKPHPAQVKVSGGAIVVSYDDENAMSKFYHDPKNFPIRITLTKNDALTLVAAICERIAKYDLF
jgi:hypothetical protein